MLSCPVDNIVWAHSVVRVLIYNNKHSAYDIIIGMDVMQKLGFILGCAKLTMSWNENVVSFHPLDYFLNNTLGTSSYTDFDDLEGINALEAGTINEPILHSKYEAVNTQDVAFQQTHLNPMQRNELVSLLANYTVLFSGKLGKYPHRKVHLETK